MKNTLKICSYNVGKWTDGIRSGMTPEEIPARKAGWEAFLSENDPDFLLFEEAGHFLDEARTIPPYETLFQARYPYVARPETESRLLNSVMFCGKYPIEDMTVRAFESGSGRPFVTFHTTVGDRKLTIAVAHLSIEGNSEGIRQQDLAELARRIEREEFDILTGDFNTFTIGEFDVFPKAQMVNHGNSGDFRTWPHPGKWNQCIDNIIVRKGLTIGSIRLGTALLSDHMALMAEIGF